MTEIVKIPAERVKVLVGESGATKKRIEERCNVELDIDPDGEVQIIGDPADVFFARDIVKAIGRGFTPENALRLMGHDYGLYVIQLKEHASSDKAIARLKGRVIGENGRIKIQIEDSTDSIVSVYGSTVSIISRIDTMEYAKEAIGMLVDGSRHTSVLRYLARVKREIMESRLKGQ
ncbi:MAG: KH domain-containing protein [Candidatus ainarchaeum sp.]|nr:KH domain-containing protein [Candidatus ainarchaeum sp.]